MSSGYGLTPTTKALHVSFSYVFDTADCTDGEASVSPFRVLDVLQVHVREVGSMPYLTARVSSTANDLTPDRAPHSCSSLSSLSASASSADQGGCLSPGAPPQMLSERGPRCRGRWDG